MSHESHYWSRGCPPPVIRAHSIAKHRVLEEYLKLYVATLTKNFRIERLQVTIVDAFAGGNLYTDEITRQLRPGSPSIVLRAMAEAESAVNEKRTKPFKLIDDYFFIEKDRGAYEYLEDTLKSSGYSGKIGNSIFLRNDDFVKHYIPIIEFINAKSNKGRAIFIFDQCGYAEVPFDCIRHILISIEHAEIILTFAAEFLVDYLSDEKTNRRLVRNPELDLQKLASKLDKTDPRWKQLIQFELHSDVRKLTNARFFTPFFIRSSDSHRDIWLIHLSKHPTAKDVMTGLHWRLQNSFSHFGKPGLNMLGYDPDVHPMDALQRWLPGFYFDESARALTLASLHDQLPKFLSENCERIDFSSLFTMISNDTPATTELLREALQGLAHHDEVAIRDETGQTPRRK
jgi:three-Cys-motif partner protein